MTPWDAPEYKAIEAFWHEPDFVRGCAYGLPFVMKRNPQKAWCGYVGVSKGHPHFGLSYSDDVVYPQWRTLVLGAKSPISLFVSDSAKAENTNRIELDLVYEAPGGLTWASGNVPDDSPDGRWWFGFDCVHAGDLSPQDAIWAAFARGTYPWSLRGDAVYRDAKFVERACRELAAQLSDFASNFPETHLT